VLVTAKENLMKFSVLSLNQWTVLD